MSALPIFIYSDRYNMDLGEHVFPSVKYRYIREALRQDERFSEHKFLEPLPLSYEEAASVHKKAYLEDLRELNFSKRVYRSELPLNRMIVDAFFLAAGGTLLAAEMALQHRLGMNLAGGFHHAFADHAEGFCYLNDVAIAIRVLQKQKRIRKALVIDLDVHQGNGTARIFRSSRSVYTFSVHEEKNYPPKEKGSLNVGLESGTSDEQYLEALEKNLEYIKSKFKPDLVVYVAGVDPYENDRLGGLSVSKEGMARRDILVRDYFQEVPMLAVLAGGYAINTQDTVDLHVQTCEVLAGFR
ncbi:MAG: histone deacetylase [Leptospiraceae bacterium]|nr:histone deacetylase [Leptospiraceae bacterium]